MSYDEDQFNEIRNRIMKRWPELAHPRLKAKVNFDDTIHALIDKCSNCPEEEFSTNVYRLLITLPDSWRDQEFEEKLEESGKTTEVKTPHVFCGQKVRNEFMTVDVEYFDENDWDVVFNALINLFHRRGLLIQKDMAQVITGETLNDGSEE